MTQQPQASGSTAKALAGTTAIVTGGARGLGFAFTRALARAGTSVTILDKDVAVAVAAEELCAQGLDVRALLGDVTVQRDVEAAVAQAARDSGTVDILVNNAAVVRGTQSDDPLEKAVADYEFLMDTNVKGPTLMARAVVPLMALAGRGDIVNIATDHVHTCGWPEPVDHADASSCPWRDERRRPGWVGMDLYDASKWAIFGLTQAWAKELRPRGIRVNTLSVGATDSPVVRARAGFDGDKQPPAELLSSWVDPAALGDLLVELVLEGPDGRSGDSIGVWRGHPTRLGPASPSLNIPPDFNPATDMRGKTNS